MGRSPDRAGGHSRAWWDVAEAAGVACGCGGAVEDRDRRAFLIRRSWRDVWRSGASLRPGPAEPYRAWWDPVEARVAGVTRGRGGGSRRPGPAGPDRAWWDPAEVRRSV